MFVLDEHIGDDTCPIAIEQMDGISSRERGKLQISVRYGIEFK